MDSESSILDKLDAVAPIHKFDAFPKVPPTYKAKTSGGGFTTLVVLLASVLLILNDVHEYIWGWPDSEFSVDNKVYKTMSLNVDMIVGMPCQYLSVDLRDAVGDRLHLSNGFTRDGTAFDPSQARELLDHQVQETLAARDAVALSRRSKGLFSFLSSSKPKFPPTYKYKADASACRIYGSVEVKKVTGNLHITTAGHGYASHQHTDHSMMNLSHIITEFSFGPFFPAIIQPLDNSFEMTTHPFTVFQYYVTVVPTTYHASRSNAVSTNQYSVTHYTKEIEHGQGAPGIFFKYDVDPISIDVYQRTTSFVQFFIRVVGVIGGVWVCAGWAFKITGKAVEVVVGNDQDTIVTEVKTSGRKSRWAGGSLSKRKTAGAGWEGEHSPAWSPAPGSGYSSYANTPLPGSGFAPASPYPPSPFLGGGSAGFPTSPRPPPSRGASGHYPGAASGFPPPSPAPYPASPLPGTPGAAGFPSSPSPYTPSGYNRSFSGGSSSPLPPSPSLNGSTLPPPPPQRGSYSSTGSGSRPPSSLNPNRLSGVPGSPLPPTPGKKDD